MGKDIKRELFVYTTGDYFSLKEYFEDKAREGWLIEKIGFNIAKYKRIEPTDLTFIVDIYPNFNEGIDKDDLTSYKSKFEDAGWSHAASLRNLHIFYSKTEDNLVPVHSQDEINKMIVDKPLQPELRTMIMQTLLSIMYFILYFPYDYDYLFSNVSMVMPFCLPLMFLGLAASTAREYLWFKKRREI